MRYHNNIIIEVVGHDHIADLRYHSSNGVWDFKDPSPEYNFHNQLTAPGVTPYDGTNPGVAHFEINDDRKPFNLTFEFLYLESTIGLNIVPAYEDLEFYSFNYTEEYGLNPLVADDIAKFYDVLV